MLSFEQYFILLFYSFPLLFAFVVGGLGFKFCVFVAGWRHALRSEWPFIIIIIIYTHMFPLCHRSASVYSGGMGVFGVSGLYYYYYYYKMSC